MNGVLTLMVLFKIVSVKDALAGFGNSGLITVVILFIVAQAITSTGGADWLVTKLLGSPSDTMLAQVRMCLITAVFSSFVNDTPVFCIMLPIVLSWAAKTRINIRQLLIPLSYCCLLGGLNTSIGTSTNLVVTGQFYSKILNPGSEYFQPGLSPISLFGVTPYGIPNVIWGIIYILYASPFLLTGGAGLRVFSRVTRTFKRVTSDGDDASLFDYGTDFIFGLLVSPTSPAIGKTVQDAHLRHLEGVYLASVRRNGRMNHAVGSEFVIAVGDVLYFSGIPDGVDQLATKHGLLPLSDATETLDTSDLPNLQAAFGVARIAVPRADSTRNLTDYDSNANVPIVGASGLELIQATINKGSDVIGRTIRDCAFRSRFHAAVVSIKRNGMPLPWTGPTIGDEVLRAGDQLLLDVGPQFWTTPDVNSTFQDIGKSGQVRAHNEFMLPMRVTRTLAGASVQKAGLRQLPNAFLVAIERGSTTLHAVSPEEILEVGDVAWFAGNAASVRFIRNTPGLVPLAERQARRLHNVQHVERRLVQAIIDRESPLVGRTPAEVQFRQQFNAAVVAVARKGERVRSKPSEVVIQASDILLLDAGPAFAQQHKDSKYFSILIEMEQTNPPRYLHTAICIALVATAFVLYALNVLDIVVGAAVAAGAMLITGCLSGEQARQSIRWDVYLMIAGSFGVSAGMEQSGGAAAIANLIVTIGKNAGGSGFVIAAIYMATMLLSQIISNNSAAALLFPIAATISKNDGIDVRDGRCRCPLS